MKSDREFLDGIYEKAARYQDASSKEKQEHVSFRRRFSPIITTGLTACALFAGVIVGKNIGIFNKNEIAEEDLASRTREASEITKTPSGFYDVSKAQYAADAALKAAGVVQDVEMDEERITIHFLIKEDYTGNLTSDSLVTITASRSSLIEESDLMQAGEQAILCLEPAEDKESFQFSSPEEDIYLYAGEEDGEAVYESLTGIRHTTQDFISP